MKDNDNNVLKIDESLFEVPLQSIPNTNELTSRIIQVTATMPQHSDSAQPSKKKSSMFDFLKPAKYIAPFAVAASVALVAVLVVVPNTSEILEPSVSVATQEGFSIDDSLDFEEAMVLLDEQLFAQL